MTRDDFEVDADLLFLDPPEMDQAILGLATRADGLLAVCYDREACIRILAKDMGEEAAEEWFEFNTASAYVGEHTPVFLSRIVGGA